MDNFRFPPEEARDIRFQSPTFIDPLTGLLNQYYLHQFLPAEIEKAKLNNYPLTIFMMDLDGFKNINDTYGHLCGDEILKQLAAVLKKFVRQTDIVVRYAGDEFAMLLPTADQARGMVLADRLIEEITNTPFIVTNNKKIQLGISIGCATYPDDTKELSQLVDLADKALYLSKNKGKNRVSQAREVSVEAASYLVAMDSFPCPKFIDRDNEINRLKQIFETIVLRTGLLHAAFISSRSGSGRSRLLNEFNNYAHHNDAILLHCRASLVQNQNPYYLFASAISEYIDKAGFDNSGLREIMPNMSIEELSGLGSLIPSIEKFLRNQAPPQADDKNARLILFKSFLNFLIELEKLKSVVISFDDIHWADKASLELLRYLITKQDKNGKIFIVCSFLEEKSRDASGSGFPQLWEEVRLRENFTHIALNNFSLEDTILMIKAIFPGLEASADFFELVYGTTHGNASFIEEMLKSLVENAVIYYQDERWQIKKDFSIKDVPVSIEEVITKRLKSLDQETKEMIVQAAVIGEDFSIDTLKKINNKDEGFMLELLNRAKKMRLVDELDTKGKFGFTNANIKDLLYKELSSEERQKLHYKIGQYLEQEHKDDVSGVAGELAFHFGKTPQTEEADKYSRMVSQRLTGIFNPTEIIEYLDKLAQDMVVREEKTAPVVQPLGEILLMEAFRLVRNLQGVVKNFQLYPPGMIRLNSIKEATSIMSTILKETDTIIFSEVEKSLVINGRRVSPKEAEHNNTDPFLMMMVEHGIKSLSFTHKITEEELNAFIENFCMPPFKINEAGGWEAIVEKASFKGINIEEVQYMRSRQKEQEFSGRGKIEDIMLMEFLLGKVENPNMDKQAFFHALGSEPKRFAQAIMSAAGEAVKEGRASGEGEAVLSGINKLTGQILQGSSPATGSYAKDLAKVISELKPAIRNNIIRSQMLDKEAKKRQLAEKLLEETPDDVVVDMISEEYEEKQKNILAFKDFIDKVPVGESRKRNIVDKISRNMAKTEGDRKEFDYLGGKIKWEELPVDKRVNNIMRLPDEYYKPQTGKIKALLEELDRSRDKEHLETMFHHLLVKSKELGPELGKDIQNIVKDFIKTPFAQEKHDSDARVDALLKRLSIELDAQIFSGILEIFADIVRDFALQVRGVKNVILELEKPAVKKNYLFIQRFLAILSQRLETDKERNPTVYNIVSEFVASLSSAEFLEILVYSVIASPYQKVSGLKNVFSLLGEKLVDALISLENRTIAAWSDSFREYLVRRKIADLFNELGEPALKILKQRLSEEKAEMTVAMIELVGYLKKEEWVDLFVPLLNHKDSSLRSAIARTLGNIGGKRSAEIILRMISDEKDRNVLALAKKQLQKLNFNE